MVPNPPQNDRTLALIVGTPSTTVSAMVATKPGSGMTFPGSYDGRLGLFCSESNGSCSRLVWSCCCVEAATGIAYLLLKLPHVSYQPAQYSIMGAWLRLGFVPCAKSWTHPIIQRRPVGDHTEDYTLPERLDRLFAVES